MKITRKNKNKTTRFDCLPLGAVFEYWDNVYEKVYYLKQEEYGAVDLEEGRVGYFENDTAVIPLDAELIVRGVLNEDTNR